MTCQSKAIAWLKIDHCFTDCLLLCTMVMISTSIDFLKWERITLWTTSLIILMASTSVCKHPTSNSITCHYTRFKYSSHALTSASVWITYRIPLWVFVCHLSHRFVQQLSRKMIRDRKEILKLLHPVNKMTIQILLQLRGLRLKSLCWSICYLKKVISCKKQSNRLNTGNSEE